MVKKEEIKLIRIVLTILVLLLINSIIGFKTFLNQQEFIKEQSKICRKMQNLSVGNYERIETIEISYPKFHSEECGDMDAGKVEVLDNSHSIIYVDSDCNIKSIPFSIFLGSRFYGNYRLGNIYIKDKKIEMERWIK